MEVQKVPFILLFIEERPEAMSFTTSGTHTDIDCSDTDDE